MSMLSKLLERDRKRYGFTTGQAVYRRHLSG